MIIMNQAKRKKLDESIRTHAQAMYDLGASGGDYEKDKTDRAWEALNKVIDGERGKVWER